MGQKIRKWENALVRRVHAPFCNKTPEHDPLQSRSSRQFDQAGPFATTTTTAAMATTNTVELCQCQPPHERLAVIVEIVYISVHADITRAIARVISGDVDAYTWAHAMGPGGPNFGITFAQLVYCPNLSYAKRRSTYGDARF